MRTNKTLYVIELKMNKSAEAAMKQINLKNYAAKFSLCHLPVTRIGLCFEAERRTISDWKIE